MIVAKPPEPVASLSNIKLFPCPCQGGRRHVRLRLGLQKKLPRLVEKVPGGVILVMADPDGEIVRYPASGEEATDAICGRMVAQVFAHAYRPDRWMPRGAAIQGP